LFIAQGQNNHVLARQRNDLALQDNHALGHSREGRLRAITGRNPTPPLFSINVEKWRVDAQMIAGQAG